MRRIWGAAGCRPWHWPFSACERSGGSSAAWGDTPAAQGGSGASSASACAAGGMAVVAKTVGGMTVLTRSPGGKTRACVLQAEACVPPGTVSA
jgi:hypothetical protein